MGKARHVTWVHLSDLHFETQPEGEGPGLDQKRCWDALEADIEELRETTDQGKPACTPDFIVLSGDIVKKGANRNSFDQAHHCIERWCEAASVPSDRVFVIPGNHDINRDEVPADHTEGEGDAQAMLDLAGLDTHSLRESIDRIWEARPVRQAIERKFDHYREFADRYAPVKWGPLHSWQSLLEINGIVTQLIGFNSVWTGGDSQLDKPGYPVIGAPQREWIDEVSQGQDAELTFILQHNPISYLHAVDSLRQANWIDKHDAIVFSGHLHQSALAERRSVRGRHLESIGGALYVNYRYTRGYSFGTLVQRGSQRQVTLGLRSLSPDSTFFSWDVSQDRGATDGLVTLRQDLDSPNLGAPIPRRTQLCIEQEKAYLRFDGDFYSVQIEKTYVNPTRQPWPCAEAQVLVNAFPDDVARSRAFYREHPLELHEIEFFARCNGELVTPTVIADFDSSKSLLIPFGSKGEAGVLQPNEKATLDYSFRVNKKYWGPYFERHISHETERLECELTFPRGLLSEMSLVHNPRLHAEPIDRELSHEERGDHEIYRWENIDPPLQSRYRFMWSFADIPSTSK